MSNVYFVGIDISLNGTGIAIKKNGELIGSRKIGVKNIRGMHRIEYVLSRIKSFLGLSEQLKGFEVPLEEGESILECNTTIVIEGYAFGAGAKGMVFDIAEMGYAIKTLFWKCGQCIIIVPPTSLKKFITGSGAAKKQVMLKEVCKRFGQDFDDDNECDAFCLATFGESLVHLYAREGVVAENNDIMEVMRGQNQRCPFEMSVAVYMMEKDLPYLMPQANRESLMKCYIIPHHNYKHSDERYTELAEKKPKKKKDE